MERKKKSIRKNTQKSEGNRIQKQQQQQHTYDCDDVYAHLKKNSAVRSNLFSKPIFASLVVYFICMKCTFLRVGKLFSSSSGSFLELSAAGHAGGPRVYYHRCNFGPPPGSVARALGVQSRASWLFFTGLLSATPSRSGPWKPHTFSYSLCCCCCCYITPSLQLSNSVHCGSHGTTAVVHQASPFVTATGGASVRVFCVPRFLPSSEIPAGTNTQSQDRCKYRWGRFV